MKKNNQICFLCGKEGADSDDHNPPSSLFYANENLRTPLLTMRAHERCQNSFSQDKEIFVKKICTACFQNDAAWRKFWNDISPSLKKPNKKSIRKLIKNSIVLDSENTQLLEIEFSVVKKVITKIISALYFKHYNQILNTNEQIEIYLYEWDNEFRWALQAFFQEKGTKLEFHTSGNHDEFIYSFFGVPELNQSTWMLIFYNRILF